MKNRLFIDPGSVSTGYAFFKGMEMLQSGTIKARGTKFERMADLYNKYYALMHVALGNMKPDEVLLETLPVCTNPKIAFNMKPMYYSVGAITAAVQGRCEHIRIIEDKLYPSQWQKYIGWDKTKTTALKQPHTMHVDVEGYRRRVRSLDELAAIAMGVFYNEVKLKGNA